ncbi:MAG TPA: HNH endonuclease signature motif containing protein [Jatrophihabitantaceae bacterium]
MRPIGSRSGDQSGTWRRILTDPVTGQILDYGRRTYRPPRVLTDFVVARDHTCIFPHCNRPARSCEIDHGKDWRSGGQTCEHNLHPLCTRHHHAKHNTGWRVKRQPDGSYLWTDPTSHTYTGHPPDDG